MIMDEKCENERTADVLVIKVNKSEYVIKSYNICGTTNKCNAYHHIILQISS